MTTVVLFHHVQGLTAGVRELAGRLADLGHEVHTPDLFDGLTFPDLDAGMAHVRSIGFEAVAQRGVAAAGELPADMVYAGISLGVIPAQQLAQTRPGARGAILLEACVPPEEFGGPWPDVPVQVHGMDADPSFAGEGDLDAARALVAAAADGELFCYPGDRHLFTDSSLPSYDAEATALVVDRLATFLDRV